MRPFSLKLTSAAMSVITFTTFGMGCGGPSDTDSQGTPPPQVQQRELTGQELYKGMIFGVGPAAHHFDELWERPEIKARLVGDELLARREMAAERITARIAEMNPAFFEHFSTDLRSGQHLTIDRLLSKTKSATQAAADSLRAQAGLRREDMAVYNDKVAGTWLYEETVVAVAIAAVLLVVVTQIDVTPLMEDSKVTALHRDVWVNQLANKRFSTK